MPYETSAKVPLIIKYPNKIQKGKIIETAYSQIDFAPTLLGMLNLDHDLTLDGFDGSREVLQNDTSVSDTLFDEPKIVFAYAGFWVTEKFERGWIAAITNGFKFILDARGEPTFFDINTDPDEIFNYVADPSYANIISLLRRAAIEQLDALGPWKATIYFDRQSCMDSRDVLHTENSNGREIDIFCENLSKNQEFCDQKSVRKHCPLACGVTCKDSTGEFSYEGLTMKCSDISRSYCHSRSVRYVIMCDLLTLMINLNLNYEFRKACFVQRHALRRNKLRRNVC